MADLNALFYKLKEIVGEGNISMFGQEISLTLPNMECYVCDAGNTPNQFKVEIEGNNTPQTLNFTNVVSFVKENFAQAA